MRYLLARKIFYFLIGAVFIYGLGFVFFSVEFANLPALLGFFAAWFSIYYLFIFKWLLDQKAASVV